MTATILAGATILIVVTIGAVTTTILVCLRYVKTRFVEATIFFVRLNY